MNSGKRFENNFKKSIPNNVYIYRFKDGSASWGGNEKVRFQAKNICDFMLYRKPYLFLLELKSTKNKSLPNMNIKKHQLDNLIDASKYEGTVCGLLIEFSKYSTVYFIEINEYKKFLDMNYRKSLPINYLQDHGIKVEVIIKKVNIIMNIEKMIIDAVKRGEHTKKE